MSDLHLPLSIVLGVGLAAATGFRVFLPMLIVGVAAYAGHLPLDGSFAWLATPSALTMLSVAALAEILAYYVPAVDNLLFENRAAHYRPSKRKWRHIMSEKAVLENVRRYRIIASLYRQTAAFRPDQKWSLLAQAFEYERLARTELESHFTIRDCASRWEMAAAA